MPLSKKRQAEYMRNYRKTVIPGVIPKLTGCKNDVMWLDGEVIVGGVIPEQQPWEVTDWASYKGPVVPIPNCKDGRDKDATNC